MKHMGNYLSYSMIIMNILLFGALFWLKWTNISWAKTAAREAEVVASIPCSGHGFAYLDGLSSDDGNPVCECYACFVGYHCSSVSFPCIADADSGTPLFLEPFWRKHRENSSVFVSSWHRLGYSYPGAGADPEIIFWCCHMYYIWQPHSTTWVRPCPGGSEMSVELQKYILKLHDLVGNAVTEGRHLLFGTGSTQLLNAAVHSLSSFSPVTPALVLASIPYYGLYREQSELFETKNYKFKGEVSNWKNKTSGEQMLIEFVTSPNNPDSQLKEKVLQKGPLVKAIHDHVYYWPHYTPITSPSDEDIMIFSISKLTGHAGSRFGWALVKDEKVYEKMKKYVVYNTMGVSHDTQLRMLELLKSVVDGGAKQLFNFGHETIEDKWQRLNKVISKSSRFSLQSIPSQFCTYYQQVRQPSPAYAWLKCERKEDANCYEVFKSAGILGRQGRVFDAEDRYIRLSLLKSNDDFEELLSKIELLVDFEHHEITTLKVSKLRNE